MADEWLLRQQYKFVRDEDDKAEVDPVTRRFEAALFRDFVVADLSRHKEGRVGLRWRTAEEVVAGKGERFCGERGCQVAVGLVTLELPFSYTENDGTSRTTLVRLVACDVHHQQLLDARKAKKEQDDAENAEKKLKKKLKKKQKKKDKKEKRRREEEHSG